VGCGAKRGLASGNGMQQHAMMCLSSASPSCIHCTAPGADLVGGAAVHAYIVTLVAVNQFARKLGALYQLVSVMGVLVGTTAVWRRRRPFRTSTLMAAGMMCPQVTCLLMMLLLHGCIPGFNGRDSIRGMGTDALAVLMVLLNCAFVMACDGAFQPGSGAGLWQQDAAQRCARCQLGRILGWVSEGSRARRWWCAVDLLVDVVDNPRPERGHVEVVHLPAGAVTIWRARNGRCSWLRTSVWLISLSFALKK
jgi:hypothetical protein